MLDQTVNAATSNTQRPAPAQSVVDTQEEINEEEETAQSAVDTQQEEENVEDGQEGQDQTDEETEETEPVWAIHRTYSGNRPL